MATEEVEAAGVPPAVEGGILPPGIGSESVGIASYQSASAGQDAQLYGRRDARRYNHGDLLSDEIDRESPKTILAT